MRLEKRSEKEVDMPKIIPFDTLAYAKELEGAGIKSEHAAAHAKVLAEVLETGFSAKQDSHRGINDLSQEMSARFSKVDAEFAKIDVRFEKVDAKFESLENKLRSEMIHMKVDIIKWVVGIAFGQLAIIFPAMFAMIKYVH